MTDIEIAKQLMSRMLRKEPSVAANTCISFESESVVTYCLAFMNSDGELQQSYFTVDDSGSLDLEPKIIVDFDDQLHETTFGCKSPDEDFYSDYWANIFLDSFYAWRANFFEMLEIEDKKNHPQELDGKLEWA